MAKLMKAFRNSLTYAEIKGIAGIPADYLKTKKRITYLRITLSQFKDKKKVLEKLGQINGVRTARVGEDDRLYVTAERV